MQNLDATDCSSMWCNMFYLHLLSFEESDVEDGGIKIDKLKTENFER